MELKIIHFYPDLMSLYGSYANVSVLRRYLEALGCAVTVQAVVRGRARTSPAPTFSSWGPARSGPSGLRRRTSPGTARR